MPKSTRFTVACHILASLAFVRDRYVSSEIIAQSVQTNPVVVRRLLALFHDAGWVESQVGSGGGTRLAVFAEAISLQEVFDVVEAEGVFATHAPNPACPVGQAVERTLFDMLADAEAALRSSLADQSIADLAASARRQYALLRGQASR